MEFQSITCKSSEVLDLLIGFAIYKKVHVLDALQYPIGKHFFVKEKWAMSVHSLGYNDDGSENVVDCPAYKADKRYRCGKHVTHKHMPWRDADSMTVGISRILVEVTAVKWNAGSSRITVKFEPRPM